MIFDPTRAAAVQHPDMPPDRFYLVSVILDRPNNFDFEILTSGPRAYCEALAISAAKKGQCVWFPTDQPFDFDKDSK